MAVWEVAEEATAETAAPMGMSATAPEVAEEATAETAELEAAMVAEVAVVTAELEETDPRIITQVAPAAAEVAEEATAWCLHP